MGIDQALKRCHSYLEGRTLSITTQGASPPSVVLHSVIFFTDMISGIIAVQMILLNFYSDDYQNKVITRTLNDQQNICDPYYY